MNDYGEGTEQDVRIRVFESFKDVFSSAPIRLMSRTVSTMRSMGYDDLASAIGDLDWRTVPADDQEDPFLRDDWEALLVPAFNNMSGWLHQLASRPLAYNLDSLGYPAVVEAWSGMWQVQLGLEFKNKSAAPPEVFIFHGGNQALQAAFIGVAEARRDRAGTDTPATVLVPIPSFSCPMDQMALQGMQAYLLPPTDPGMDPGPEDIAKIPEGVDIDAVYAMPVKTRPAGPSNLIACGPSSRRCSTVGPTPGSSSIRSMSGCTRGTTGCWRGSMTMRASPTPLSLSIHCQRATASPGCVRVRCSPARVGCEAESSAMPKTSWRVPPTPCRLWSSVSLDPTPAVKRSSRTI